VTGPCATPTLCLLILPVPRISPPLTHFPDSQHKSAGPDGFSYLGPAGIHHRVFITPTPVTSGAALQSSHSTDDSLSAGRRRIIVSQFSENTGPGGCKTK
jgi:hypothetical protein